MKPLLGNILLALAWLAVSGDFAPGNFLLGLLFGLGVLWLAGDLLGTRGYARRVIAAARLVLIFLWELVVASARVARDVVTPRIAAQPAIVAVDLAVRGDLEILLLSTLVTLTPGTVVVHVAEDHSRMYVYGMYVGDAEAFERRLRHVFERRILQVTRAEAP